MITIFFQKTIYFPGTSQDFCKKPENLLIPKNEQLPNDIDGSVENFNIIAN